VEEKKFAGKNCLNGSKSSFCIVIMHGSITFICNIANLKNTTVAMSLSFLLYNMGKLPTKKIFISFLRLIKLRPFQRHINKQVYS
jgi:hypothetical protein